MKTELYSAHLPGSLGLLTVTLINGARLRIHYTGPKDTEARTLPSLQTAVDRDLEDCPLLERLSFSSYLNGVIAARVKKALKTAEAPLPTVSPMPLSDRAGKLITVENIHHLPEGVSSATRARIHLDLGIDDPEL